MHIPLLVAVALASPTVQDFLDGAEIGTADHYVSLDTSGKYTRPVATQIVPATAFYRAEEYHQKYLVKNPGGYTCHVLRD